MKRYLKLYTALVLLLYSLADFGQTNIVEIFSNPNNNYFTIRDYAEAFFYRVGTIGTGWKEYKQWKFLVRNNIAPNGGIPDFVKNNKNALNEFIAPYLPPHNLTETGMPIGYKFFNKSNIHKSSFVYKNIFCFLI